MQSSASLRARQLASLVLAVLVAVVGVVTLSPSADAAPTAPAAVVVPQPCAISLAYPEGQSPAKIRELYGTHYGFTMVGRYWDDPAYQGIVRVIWETTDAIACTPFLEDLRAHHGSQLTLNASALSGWKSGDYGLTRALTVSLDFPQLKSYYDKGDHGHVARLFVHEITHAYQRDRGDSPAYWSAFVPLHSKLGRLGGYGWDSTEVMAEVVGWYVARCAQNNPYTSRYQAYYDYAKGLFGGKEFGPPLGQPMDCSQQVFPAPPPAPPAPLAAPAPVPAAPDVPTPESVGSYPRLEPFDPMMAALTADDAPAVIAAQR
ncbi:MAG TPA: hypothetical protein PLA44_06460 [Propionibacteriaceae bacterium]|nr:hypothetical protein [Propionibacteriaceae bacterium]